MNDDNDDRDDRSDDPGTREVNPRRAFIRTAAAAAAGAGALVVSGQASAAKKGGKGKGRKFEFSTNLTPASLTKANISKISDAIASQLAVEAKAGAEQAPLGFHIRIGGGHSRVFSKTADHKNVSHSEVIIEGSGP